MVLRRYLPLYARACEDTPLPWEKGYQIGTAATGLYRRIRASTERALPADRSRPITQTVTGRGRVCLYGALPRQYRM
jgi:hypothetical protein